MRRGAAGIYGKYECFVMQMLCVCVHPETVFNAAFCMTCRLLMLVENAKGDHMKEALASLMTVLLVAMSVSFSLPRAVVVTVFIICRCVCVGVLRCGNVCAV